MNNRFYRDNTNMVFEEVEPDRIRGVTAWDGGRHISDETVPKKQWEAARGPLVEVPNPWMTDGMKVLRVQDVINKWGKNRQDTGGVSALLAELRTALGHEPEKE